MKIIQLITAFQLGGAEKVAVDIAINIQKVDVEMEFIAIFKNDTKFSIEMKNKLLKNNIIFKEFGLSSKWHKWKYFSLLISTIQTFFLLMRIKPDIVHSHTDLPDFVLSSTMKIFSILRLKKPKLIRTIHNTQLWPTHEKIGYYVEKSFNNDYVIFISQGAKNAYCALREKNNLNISDNTYFISNGIDTNCYINQCSYDILKQHSIVLSKDKINFLFAGRFVEQKGFDLLLESFRLLEKKVLENIEIFAFGSGEMEQLVYDSKYKNIPIKIFLPTTKLNLLYGCFDFLIMPSRFEGLPLVPLESLSSRLLVISSDAPGLNEAIPENWPLKFKNENIYDLRDILIRIINKKVDLEELRDVGREFVKNKFNLHNMVSSYEDIYTKEEDEV